MSEDFHIQKWELLSEGENVKPHIPFKPVYEGYLGYHPKMKRAHALGWDDGHDLNYSNPFTAGSDEWWRYEDGYQEGQARFFAEESTPLSEQIALAEMRPMNEG